MASTYNIDAATVTNYTDAIPSWSVDPYQIKGAENQKETRWHNDDAKKQLGYFYSDSEYQSSIIMKTIWNVGGGYTANTALKTELDSINGWGKESFLDILFNMEIMAEVTGNGYAEIIRNPDDYTLANFKVIDPSVITHITNRKGILLRYEINSKSGKNKGETIFKIPPHRILHFVSLRLGDEIGGFNKNHCLENPIKSREQLAKSIDLVQKFHAKPLIVWQFPMDKKSKMNTIITKIENAKNKGEDIFIPFDKDISHTLVPLPTNSLQPLIQLQQDYIDKFYRVVGVPQFLQGSGGKGTEADSKVRSLSFAQPVKWRQKYIEKALWNQAAIKIKLNFPDALVQTNQAIKADTLKDGAEQGIGFQDNEVTAGVGR